MQLIVISTPSAVAGERRTIEGMIKAGLQTFHLRRPQWTLEEHESFLTSLPVATRAQVVVHGAHELTSRLALKVARSTLASPEHSCPGFAYSQTTAYECQVSRLTG